MNSHSIKESYAIAPTDDDDDDVADFNDDDDLSRFISVAQRNIKHLRLVCVGRQLVSAMIL